MGWKVLGSRLTQGLGNPCNGLGTMKAHFGAAWEVIG